MKRTLNLAAALTLGVAALAPLSAIAQTSVFVTTAPPAMRTENAPGPRDGYVWVPGYWNWENNRHVWIAGQWEPVRRGYQYQRPEWHRDGNGWRLMTGGWQEARDGDNNNMMINFAPPKPIYERIPRARKGYVWVTGHWAWRGNRHHWVPGSWVRDRPGFRYVGAEWVLRDGQWNLEEARWDRVGRDRNNNGIRDRDERRDQDRDGVADAYDRDRDNDGVRNRNDADRDGDGVRNEQDRHPDDVRRY